MIIETRKKRHLIKLEIGDEIEIICGSFSGGYFGDFLYVKNEKVGSFESLFLTTSYTQSKKYYDFIEASQKLLGIPVKECKCGDKRGGLPHAHPLYIPFELKD